MDLNNIIISEWSEYYTNIGIPKDLRTSYMVYIRKLNRNGMPVIFEFIHLAKLLGRTNQYLSSAINSPINHYRTFNIPKRNGDKREILAPYPALIECQRWINKHILKNIGTAKYCHGFTKNRSIVTNATPHLNQKCLLHMDLKDFFTSIHKKQVIKVFRTAGYPPNVSYFLASLCCVDDYLPQGAATSPALSNIVAFGLDVRLTALAKKYEFKYTRYADDLTISGNYIPHAFIEIVEKIIIGQGFLPKNEKTYLSTTGSKRIVTGLSVSSDKLKIPTKYKRKLRQEVFYVVNHGLIVHMKRKKIRNPYYLSSIHGKLLFWKSIEPDNSYVINAIDKISQLLYPDENL